MGGISTYVGNTNVPLDYQKLYVANLEFAEKHLQGVNVDLLELRSCKSNMEEFGARCKKDDLDQYAARAKVFFYQLAGLEAAPLLLEDNNARVERYLGDNDNDKAMSTTTFHTDSKKSAIGNKYLLPYDYALDMSKYNRTCTVAELKQMVHRANSQEKGFFDNNDDMRRKFNQALVCELTGQAPAPREESSCTLM